MEPEPERRASLVGAWSEPDYASVNLSEPGAVPVMHALLYAGIEIEAGLCPSATPRRWPPPASATGSSGS